MSNTAIPKVIKYLILFTFIFNLFSNIKAQLFNYEYRTEIYSNLENKSFELPEKINTFAKKINASLNNSMFFDIPFLLNSKKIREHLLKPKYYKQNVGKTIFVETEDSNIVECTYFDRKSDKLLIIGSGFTNVKEKMATFIHMFTDYDIIIFNLRGHGINDWKFYNPTTWRINPMHYFFRVNTRKTKLGAEEEKDVTAVVNYFRNMKNYDKVYGLGVCYSALIFIKAQGICQKEKGIKLFDKIILDGCWLSLRNFIQKLAQDTKLLYSPQHGGWKESWLTNKEWFRKFIFWLTRAIFKVDIDTVSILPYLDEIKETPILIFYGKNDLVVTRNEFETIWNNIKTEKTAIITSNAHVRNHIKEKEFYKLSCDLFLELPHKEFISCLKNEESLKQHYIKKINSFLNKGNYITQTL